MDHRSRLKNLVPFQGLERAFKGEDFRALILVKTKLLATASIKAFVQSSKYFGVASRYTPQTTLGALQTPPNPLGGVEKVQATASAAPDS